MSNDKYDDLDDDSSADEPWQDDGPGPVFPAPTRNGGEEPELYEDSSGGLGDDSEPPLAGREREPGAARYHAAGSQEDYEDDEFDEDQLEDDWEDDFEENPSRSQLSRLTDTWPVGLIAVAAMALLLLAAGGYGVMKQRSAMEQEIRDLQAQLALAGNPGEVREARATLATMKTDNRELRGALAALRDENRQLGDTLAGLEQQLRTQRETAAAEQPSSTPAPAPTTAQASPDQPAEPAPAATASGWFVNFGSYSERPLAQQWADRLKPDAGNVVVSTVQVKGNTLYRVRVVGLSSEQNAQSVAQTLARKYELPTLWVGRQ
ncbi:SPOR domain-containing protein [Kineobactrum salinum]|uniref:SPOR domain-containing protein n=1 Tax=Kineobactrum salinum TaxID=2708301 RepID=A0A6C0U0E9_9GAMM|nr:SPOR domain-containing protein [Kineobactrum salinum]QIB65582.1 hypothetical protein G3T16_09360 [Kineobactrum salinum]